VNALRAVVAVLSALVVGLVVVVIVTASGQSSNNSARVDDIAVLRSQVREAKTAAKAAEVKAQSSGQAEVSDLKRTVSATQSDVTALQARNRVLERKIKALADCLPEVQMELNSLEIDRQSLFISPSSQVSRVCQTVVYPPSGDE
jgi:peptidoglycan hydrolase CwlO-like protein